MTVNLEPYILTSHSDCGSLVYTESVTSIGYHPFNEGTASISGTTLTFTNLDQYPVGLITIRIDISTTEDPRSAHWTTIPVTVCTPVPPTLGA